MLAIVLSLLTAFFFATANLVAQRALHLLPTPWGVWITVVGNSLFLAALHFLFFPEATIWLPANLIFVVIGLFVPGITRMLGFRGIRTMGSSVTSTAINTVPMFSTTLAILFLGERPSPLVILGVGLIVGGLMTLSWGGEKRSWRRTELLFPLTAALLFAVKDVLTRYGLQSTGQPILAAAIASLTSTLEVFLILRYLQGRSFVLPPLRVFLWFLLSGLLTGASFSFMFFALQMERVTIVSPIVNSYSVFVLFLTPLLARKIESVTQRKVLGALGVVTGVFLISIGKD